MISMLQYKLFLDIIKLSHYSTNNRVQTSKLKVH